MTNHKIFLFWANPVQPDNSEILTILGEIQGFVIGAFILLISIIVILKIFKLIRWFRRRKNS